MIFLHRVADLSDYAVDLQLLAEENLDDKSERQALVLGSMCAGVKGKAMTVEDSAHALPLVL